MLVVVLSGIIATCLAVKQTDFSVHIKGQLVCDDVPAANMPMDIFSEAQMFRYEDFMDRWTNEKGEFDFKAYVTTDAYMITPYVVIIHRCWESKEVPHRCDRKIVQPIPPLNVTVNSKTPDEKKVYNFGKVDLRFKNPAEVTVKCG
ncbi:Transthyretin-like family protein [Caenorhabditis elegans]|uniref:Transthyretin-like family protein n=1 Tax=Caenorhabditis elegans TaxID=6239 RepID=Q93832_CAEEL|nr:Transthyretin-like family protein [Caenorhabditis elegans]CAB01877.2 Transthyretin-like family protein [Caenorhabditis elegans]|eukprot:NP_492750.2 Neuropeptide-Like Protein [Caenorhabditis elegans]